MPTRAVLFVFDGVIADTENIHIAAWQRTLARLGWEVPDEICARAVEVDDRIFLTDLFAQRKIQEGDVDGWVHDAPPSADVQKPRKFPVVSEAMAYMRLALLGA